MIKEETKEKDKSALSRQIFFDRNIHNQKIKDCISGKNEERCIDVFRDIGYILGVDYHRQHPIAERYVLDFAFINEQVAVEIDGKEHLSKEHKRKDKIRDRYLRENNWVTIRIQDKDMFGYKFSFYKYLIKEIVEERRDQYNQGKLYEIDFKRFTNEEDYE